MMRFLSGATVVLAAITFSTEVSAQQPSEYLTRGNDAYSKQDFGRAIEQYSLAISGAPKMHEAYFNRGLCFMELDSSARALRDFDSVISIAPSFSNAYRTRGYLYMKIRQFDGALADMNFSLATDSTDMSTFLNRGHVKNELGDSKGAAQDFEKAIRLDSNSADAYLALAVVKAKTVSEVSAYPYFKKALDLRPNDPVMLINYGQAAVSAGYILEGGAAWRKYLQVDPTSDRGPQIRQVLLEMSLDETGSIERNYTDSSKRVSIRLPGGWYDVRQDDGETFNYFISKDSLVDGRAMYAIGVAVQMIRDVKMQLGTVASTPTDIVAHWEKYTAESTTQYHKHDILESQPITVGDWSGNIHLIELQVKPEYYLTKLYQVVLAKENQLLWINAECPDQLWGAYQGRFRKAIELAKLP